MATVGETRKAVPTLTKESCPAELSASLEALTAGAHSQSPSVAPSLFLVVPDCPQDLF